VQVRKRGGKRRSNRPGLAYQVSKELRRRSTHCGRKKDRWGKKEKGRALNSIPVGGGREWRRGGARKVRGWGKKKSTILCSLEMGSGSEKTRKGSRITMYDKERKGGEKGIRE